jgi:hypothetical protein
MIYHSKIGGAEFRKTSSRFCGPVLGIIILASPFSSLPAQQVISTGVLVVGGGTGGVAAGIQSARMGVKTLIVEQTPWLGGMLTAAGISCTDGNDGLPSGLWSEFRQALYIHYGTQNLATGWVSETCFEPHVGDSILKSLVNREKDLTVMYNWYFEKALLDAGRVRGAEFKNKKGETLEVKAKITIDATELGDLFSDAGAAYDLGTEDPSYSKEKMAPGKTPIIQDITWAAILKNYGPGFSGILTRPPGYDPREYYCCCTSATCSGKSYPADAGKMMSYGKLPNEKYMINWPAHGNDYYLNEVEKKPLDREGEYEKVKAHTLGFIYFIQTELGFRNLGLAGDELDRGMALIPYNREGRRIRGVVRFNVNDILDPFGQTQKLYRTGISVGDYPVDHHHGQNPATPKIDFPPIPSFNLPVGALIPEKVDGLIVCEKGISVSNIVNGATRLQPVVLLTGQAAGALAAISIRHEKEPRQVNIRELQQKLLDAKCDLLPYADVKPGDGGWDAIQRVGATGILKGKGQPEGWANKTFFFPDSGVRLTDLNSGLREINELANLAGKDSSFWQTGIPNAFLSLENMEFMLWSLRKNLFESHAKSEPEWRNEFRLYWLNISGKQYDPDENIDRRETAEILDHFLRPFSAFPVKIDGNE